MSATLDPHADGKPAHLPGRPLTVAGENLMRLAIPPGTPDEARATIQRLVELTSILARRAGQLQEALDSRVAIEQAKGIVAERYAVSLDDAFRILRAAARSNRVRLHDVASRVVPAAESPAEVCGAVLKTTTKERTRE